MDKQENFNTLAHNGTADFDHYSQLSGKLVFGLGSDLTDKKALKRKAKCKAVTQKIILSMIEVAKKKGAFDRVKSYRNSLYCVEKFYSSEGRVHGLYCKNRFCTVCCGIRKAMLIKQYLPEIKKWEDPRSVTLTVKAVPAEKLAERLTEIKRVFQRILDKYKKRHKRSGGLKLIGIKSLECNFNPVAGTYNPHLHLIVPNIEIATTLVIEWQKEWNKGGEKLATPWAQLSKRVGSLERGLIEAIKYGIKIFTEPDMDKSGKSKVPRMVYAAALDTIFAALKPYNLFCKFGFNLPKQSKQNKQSPIVLEQYDEWVYDPALYDWHNPETGELLAGYIPPPELQWILAQNIDTDLQ